MNGIKSLFCKMSADLWQMLDKQLFSSFSVACLLDLIVWFIKKTTIALYPRRQGAEDDRSSPPPTPRGSVSAPYASPPPLKIPSGANCCIPLTFDLQNSYACSQHTHSWCGPSSRFPFPFEGHVWWRGRPVALLSVGRLVWPQEIYIVYISLIYSTLYAKKQG